MRRGLGDFLRYHFHEESGYEAGAYYRRRLAPETPPGLDPGIAKARETLPFEAARPRDGTVIDLRSASERDICTKFITPALRRA
jgi:hypothetical protein